MRVSREQFAQNREKIIAAAGELFLEKGFSAIGVAEVMKAAGFTHGGFYGHFDSKGQLAYEASKQLFRKTEEKWKQIISANPNTPLEALLDHYLSDERPFSSDGTCVFSSLSQEMGRQTAAIRAAFTDGLAALGRILQGVVPGDDVAERQQRALSTLSAMIGAVSLARACNDPTLAKALLSAARQELLS